MSSRAESTIGNGSSLEKFPTTTSTEKGFPPSSSAASSHAVENGDAGVRVNPESLHDPEFVRKTMRKVDFRLVPILAALYAFSLIDRTNIAFARIIGAGAELQLNTGDRYSIAVLIFFVPYVILEFPCNILLRRVGAALWIGSIATLWGASMIGMGFVKNWHALAGCRAVLGAFEAGFFPGCVYLISSWYIRQEQQSRLASFYLFSMFMTGFSPIYSYGISTIGEAYGMLAWRWLFIISGIITCVLGLAAFVLVVDFPDKAKFLAPSEIQLVRARVEYDRGDSVPDQLTWAKTRGYLADPKNWAYALMLMCATVPTYAYASFLPILMVGFGFNIRDSQLMVAPPYVFASITALIAAFAADRVNKRGPFIIFQATVTLIGFCMTGFLDGSYSRYGGAFLGLFGCSANLPTVIAWSQNNVVGSSHRAFTSALVIGFGGIGGILAGVTFREKDRPGYSLGIWFTIGAQILLIVLASTMMAWSAYRNKQARSGGKPIVAGNPHFFYTL